MENTMLQIVDVTIIMPLYNEEKTIENTIKLWIETLDNEKITWRIEIYNDGSTDSSNKIIEKLAKNNPNIRLYSFENKGFSKTLFEAYSNVSNTEYVFHTDSDIGISPKDFSLLWKERFENDFIIGCRLNRKQSFKRKLATCGAAFIIATLFNRFKIVVHDTNAPFRLIKTDILKKFLSTIEKEYPYANLFMCAYCLKRKFKIKEIGVEHDNSERKSYLNNIKTLLKNELKSIIYLIEYFIRLS